MNHYNPAAAGSRYNPAAAQEPLNPAAARVTVYTLPCGLSMSQWDHIHWVLACTAHCQYDGGPTAWILIGEGRIPSLTSEMTPCVSYLPRIRSKKQIAQASW